MHSPRLTVVRRSSSMIPTLIVFGGSPSDRLDGGEQVVGERHLVRTVHLRLDDVDGAGGGVAVGARAGEVVHRATSADTSASSDALRHRLAVGVEHGRRRHQVADVADEQQRPAPPGDRPAVARRCTRGRRPGVRTKVRPPLVTSAVRSPFIRPSQLR